MRGFSRSTLWPCVAWACGAACAQPVVVRPTQPPPAPATAAVVRLETELASLRAQELPPAAATTLRRALESVPAEAVSGHLVRFLGRADRISHRLVGALDDHPALTVIVDRLNALADEGVGAPALSRAVLDHARGLVAAARRELAAAPDLAGARTARARLEAVAPVLEAHAWRAAFLIARTVGGPLAHDRFLESFPKRLLEEPHTTLAALEPVDPAYRAMAAAYPVYVRLAAREARDGPIRLGTGRGWRRLRPGRRDPKVAKLRGRLEQLGFTAPPTGRAEHFDDALLKAIAAFQRRHALDDAGRLDKATLAAMNVPVRQRLQQLQLALAHLRDNPARLSPYRIQVNIAGFGLRLYEQGRPVAYHPVVVGNSRLVWSDEAGRRRYLNRTPTLASRIDALVLNPAWRVPRRIKEGEIDVAAERRPDLYDRYELYVDREGVEWAVQPPGPGNALGRVKFVFRGGGGVFLHDTPRQRDFQRSNRALSHGCVRVQRALELARALIDNDNHRLSRNQISSLLRTYQETPIRLGTPVPIYIEYVTVGIDAQAAGLTFYRDPYGWGPIRAAPPLARRGSGR